VVAVMRCGGLTMPLEGGKRKGSRMWSHDASGRGKKKGDRGGGGLTMPLQGEKGRKR
jgi:hypothetical protein